jgi:hypothetical protein
VRLQTGKKCLLLAEADEEHGGSQSVKIGFMSSLREIGAAFSDADLNQLNSYSSASIESNIELSKRNVQRLWFDTYDCSAFSECLGGALTPFSIVVISREHIIVLLVSVVGINRPRSPMCKDC